VRQIVPLTKELLDSMDRRDRFEAFRNYRLWVDKVRLQDRKVQKYFDNKIDRIKNNQRARKWNDENKEYVKWYRRKWYFENRGRVSEYNRMYRENKGREVS